MKGSRPALFVLLAATACESLPPSQVNVRFQVFDESGEPVQGASISVRDDPIGDSDQTGGLTSTVEGKEGSEVIVSVACPPGFVDADRPAGLRLVHTRAATGPEAPTPLVWTGLCRRAERDVALVVHTDGLSGLPVVVDGAARTRTNRDGNAHVLLTLSRDVPSVHVSLDTSSDARLKPQNPARVFALSDSDGLLVFEPAVARARVKPKPARRIERPIPYRVR